MTETTAKRVLTKDDIFGADDLQREEVFVPEWNGHLFVRTLTGNERDSLEASVEGPTGKRDLKAFRTRLLTMAIVDEEGLNLFTEKDVGKLGKKSARAINRVFTKALAMSAMRAEDMEEAAGNLPDDQSDDSISV